MTKIYKGSWEKKDQFADDTSIAITNTKGGIEEVFRLMETFGKAAGLKINVEKNRTTSTRNSHGRRHPQTISKIHQRRSKDTGHTNND